MILGKLLFYRYLWSPTKTFSLRIDPNARATVRALMMMSIQTDQTFMESFKMATKTHFLSKILGLGFLFNLFLVVGYFLFAK